MINPVALMNARKREILRRATAVKAVNRLMENVDDALRVSEMRAKIVDVMVRAKIRRAIPP